MTTTSGWSVFAQKKIGTLYLDEGTSTVRIQHTSATAVNYSALITEFLSAEKHSHSFGDWTKASDTQHKRYCSCGAEDAADHVWDEGTVSIPATAQKTGIMTYACTECTRTKLEPIPKITDEETAANAETETNAESEEISDETDAPVAEPENSPATVFILAGACILAIGIAAALILFFRKKRK